MNRDDARGAAGADAPAIALATLPPPDIRRWVARRKAEVVNAVEAGLLPLDEALSRYSLTIEEFASWERGLLRHGLGGLKAARLHHDETMERLGQEPRAWVATARANG